MALDYQEETYEIKGVHGPGAHIQSDVIIASGQAAAMVRGEVVQQDATSFKFETFVNTVPADANCILLEDVDATGGADVVTVALFAGSYKPNDLTWPDATTAGQKNAALSALRDRGLVPANKYPIYV